MMRYAKTINYLRDNPVVVMDLVKYVLAALVLFGLPIPAGLDVAAAGAVLAVLTIATRASVVPVPKHEEAVEEALRTEPPADSPADPEATAIIPAVR